VPLVVAGTTEDKPEVAGRVAWSGTGIDLRTGTPSPTRLRRAVRSALADPRYRIEAARLRREIIGAGGAASVRVMSEAAHGTSARWHAGCRCTLCRRAHSDTHRGYGRARAQGGYPLTCARRCWMPSTAASRSGLYCVTSA
jgi:hypothetical protein